MINIKKITFITFLCFIFNISNFAYSIQIDESDRNLDKIKRLIINDPEFFKKSKYFSHIIRQGIDPKSQKRIKTSILAVYMNYEKVLETITKFPELDSIGEFAWGFEFSNKRYEGLTAQFTGQKAIDRCNKHAKKKKLSGGECIFVELQNSLGDWSSGIGKNYLFKERQKREILASGKIDESDEMLNKLYKVIMTNPDFVKKSKYFKYAEKGKYNNEDFKTISLAVYMNYEKEILKLMLHPMLINFENEAWGWQTFNTDNSELFTSWNDGAVAKCNKTVIRKKLNDGKCIMIDFRKVSKGQESTFVKNLLFNERKQRQIVAQNLSKDSKTKIAKKKAD
ncbi:hypothetical protein [Candidatus Pelagibacter sp.]|uniref:hypothetical protein n=1 Tax=Candidatus Pelagibacter sp. TaxID=2024849 RepID=UPI003F85FFF4